MMRMSALPFLPVILILSQNGCNLCFLGGKISHIILFILVQARPPLFSKLSLMNYQNLPTRLLFFPWRLLPRHGTIAADTTYYPFGTRMFIPGYGWGEVSFRPTATFFLALGMF